MCHRERSHFALTKRRGTFSRRAAVPVLDALRVAFRLPLAPEPALLLQYKKMSKYFLCKNICPVLTCDDEASLGGTETRFARQTMLGAALVRLVAIFRSDVPDVKLSGRKNQVFAICTPTEKSVRNGDLENPPGSSTNKSEERPVTIFFRVAVDQLLVHYEAGPKWASLGPTRHATEGEGRQELGLWSKGCKRTRLQRSVTRKTAQYRNRAP